uniref:GPS domain-containing protein n=1 Tax=Taenia asiatica TaxID=60517 RepID=A0A0R3WBA5_TAEAS
LKCNLVVRGANLVRATVQWEDSPPYVYEFLEANSVTLGVPSLKDYKSVDSTCKMPAQLIYGPVTFREGTLHAVWFSSRNGNIHLITGNFSSTGSYVERIAINSGWDMILGDVIEVTTGDTLTCVRTDTLKLKAAELVQTPIFTSQVQLDFVTPNDVQFSGAFAAVGVHLVMAVLEPYAWEQRAPPKFVKLPIQVIPPKMTPTQILSKSATFLQKAAWQKLDSSHDTLTSYQMQFSIEAANPFHGTVEINGTNFRGTFVHNCQLSVGPCLVVIGDRIIRTGDHRVCVKAVTSDAQPVSSCLDVGITRRQGKLELYVDGAGAPLNGRTILRTRPTYGGYDPRLSYSLLFGDGSLPVTGSNLDAMTLFVHNYTTAGKFTASMVFRNGERITCEVKVDHPIDEFHVFFPNGPIGLVRKSINVTVRAISAGPVSVEIDGTIGSFYMNLTLPMQRGTIGVEEEDGDICLPQAVLETNNLYKATIYVNDSLMIDRETHNILLDGGMDIHFSTRIVRPLSAIETHLITSFEHIVLSGACKGLDCLQAAKLQWYVEAVYLNGSSWLLNDEQMTRFTQAKIPGGEITICVSEEPVFCSILPRIGKGIQTCIRSLPGSTVYINTCFQPVEFVPVTQEDLLNLLQSITSGELNSLDDVVASGLPNVISETVQTMSAQVATLINSKISEGSPESFNCKRNQVAKLLDKLATALNSISVTDRESLLSITSAIEAVVANAKEMAYPTVERIQSKLAEVAKVLPDILAASSRDNAIKFSRRFIRIGLHLLEATSVTKTLENINVALAQILQELLVPGGNPLQVTSDSVGTVCFARAGTGLPACGGNNVSLLYTDGHFPLKDVVVQASYATIYVKHPIKNYPQNKNASSISYPKVGIEEQYLTLPEPVVAVDGSLVYQPLIIHSFDIGEAEGAFVFQLHPTDIDACPQYLVAVRFVIPPMLRFDDGLGHFLWAMVPPSTSKCNLNGNDKKALLNYAYRIDVEVLAELKAEALKRTAHMRLRSEELNTLHIGYRQLNANELDRYDNENPPPLPYPYTDQINNTAYMSAFMPSCLHISPGDDEWRRDGCKVLPSSAPDEVTCECTHLTTFGAADLHFSPSANLPFIIGRTDLTHFSIGLTTTNLLLTSLCILTWRITRRIYEVNMEIVPL